MRRIEPRIYDALFVVLLVAFVALKWSDLSLPYFWDELGGFARAVFYLTDHGLSLLPRALPPELSRGHPLLIPFLHAVVFRLFGPGVVANHVFALSITLGLLTAMYLFGRRALGAPLALAACMLVASQPAFIAQSTLILLDMPLALLALLSLGFLHQQRFVAFTVTASLAVLSKETGLVLPAVALAWLALSALAKRSDAVRLLKKAPLVIIPWLVFGGFLLVQKKQNGWYFFPYHLDALSFDVPRIKMHAVDFADFLFNQQGRRWWLAALALGLVASALRRRWPLGVSLAALSALAMLAFYCFSVPNFYMNRYLTPTLPLFAWVVVSCLSGVVRDGRWLLPVAALLAFVSLGQLDPGRFNFDVDMSFRHHLVVEQQVIDALCQAAGDSDEVMGNFPAAFGIFEERSGFRRCSHPLHLVWSFSERTRFAIYNSDTDPSPVPLGQFHVIKRFQDASAWAVLLERN